MPPNKGGRGGKGGKGGGGGGRGGGGGGDKKGALWDALRVQKLAAVRYGLANAGGAPASRNHEGVTTFQLCARDGLEKSLAEMVRWYERRAGELRTCVSQVTGEPLQRRTALHLAAKAGHAGCVRLLLDAAASVDRDGSFAARQLALRDGTGKTPRELSVEAGKDAVTEAIDDFTYEESDDEDGGEGGEGSAEDALTSTQISRLKKLALREQETGTRAGGGAAAAEAEAAAEGGQQGPRKEERGELPTEMPPPHWPEVTAWAESIKLLRPICELKIERAAVAAGGNSSSGGGAAAEKEEEEGNGELDTSIDAVLVEAPPPGVDEEGGAAAAAAEATPPPPPDAADSSSSSSSSSASSSASSEVVDPALWYCHTVNRLELKLPGALTSLRGDGLRRLSALTTLILAGNDSLTTLPDDGEVGALASLPLKSLDVSHCALEALPARLPSKTLETLDVSFNKLAALGPGFADCVQLVTVAVDGNQLTSLSELPFEG